MVRKRTAWCTHDILSRGAAIGEGRAGPGVSGVTYLAYTCSCRRGDLLEPQSSRRTRWGTVLEQELRAVTGQIVDAAMTVHSSLGPGLLEKAYEACPSHELRERGLRVICQLPLPVRYRGVTTDVGYRIDLLVNDAVVIELKAVSTLLLVHTAQLLSHLRLNDFRVGLLINFHSLELRNGIRRLVNRLQDARRKPSAYSANSAVFSAKTREPPPDSKRSLSADRVGARRYTGLTCANSSSDPLHPTPMRCPRSCDTRSRSICPPCAASLRSSRSSSMIAGRLPVNHAPCIS